MDNAFLEPFALAACDTLREMANVEIVVPSGTLRPFEEAAGNIAVVVPLASAPPEFMVINFPQDTASGLARRILAGAPGDLSDSLIRDCMGEIANVIVGQAKARLAETPFRVSLSMPQILSGPLPARGRRSATDCQTLSFKTELGDLTIQFVNEEVMP